VWGIIVGILILTLLVVVHELGHYIAARRSGVVVEEFGIGLPPRAWGKKLKNGVLLSINWLPIGGFCKMQGESDAANKKGDYGKATYWQKTKILFAGVAMNWLATIVIFTILAWVGMPQMIKDQFTVPADSYRSASEVVVGTVVEGLPADKAGLKPGDEIVKVDGTLITDAALIPEISRVDKGKRVKIEYRRDGQTKTTTAELRGSNDDGKGYLGMSSGQSTYVRSTWSAPIVGVATTLQLTGETFRGVGVLAGNFFGGLAKQLSFDASVRESGRENVSAAGEGVTGPVGIVGVLFPQATQSGGVTLLMLAGIISLSLAVMNVLPIPALDGGRWLLMTIYKLRRKKLTAKTEEKFVTAGFLALFALIILITIVDVVRLF
jgi:regulator of sigma E protease